MKFQTLVVPLFILLITTILSSCTLQELNMENEIPQEIYLKYSFPNGYKSSYSLVEEQTMKQSTLGQKANSETQSQMAYSMYVKDTSNKKTNLEYEFHDIYLKMKSPQGEIEYDSNKNIRYDNQLLKPYKSLKENKLSVKIDPIGKILSFRKSSDTSDIYNDRFISTKENAERNVIESILNSCIVKLPSKPVKIGDTWEQETTFKNVIKFKIFTTYTLKASNNGIATILINSSFKPGKNELKLGGIIIDYNIQGDQTGTLEVEEKTGDIISYNTTQKIIGKQFAIRGGNVPETLSEFSINGFTKIQRILKQVPSK